LSKLEPGRFLVSLARG